MTRFLYKYNRTIGIIAVVIFSLVLVLSVAQAEDFSLQPYGPKSLTDLLNTIIKWIFNIAIPIAVIMIIWSGLLMLTSGPNPKRYEDGKKTLKYAVMGLAIIFIGKGFITLIQSILELSTK